ncbi:TPA: sodium-dependent transporter, partial [Neisseria gonorrhoeae]
LEKNYGDYPDGFLNIFGWGMSAALIMFGLLLSLLPWKHGQDFNVKDEHEHEQGGEK